MSCFAKFSKFMVIGCNILVAVATAVCCGLIYSNLNSKDEAKFYLSLYSDAAEFRVFIAVTVCVLIGAVASVFYWCCGNKRWFRICYLIFYILVIALEVACCIVSYSSSESITKHIEDRWFSDDYTEERQSFEKEFRCCGYNSSTSGTSYSCGCTGNDCSGFCYEKIKDQISDSMKYTNIATIVLIVLQFILVIMMMYLACCDKSVKQPQAE